MGEDQIGRGKRHTFPEQEQCQVVAGEYHAERTADVDECSHMLAGVRQMQRVDHPDQRHDGENGGEDDTQLVDLRDQDFLPDDLRSAVVARLHREHGEDGQRRDQKQVRLADWPSQEGDRQGAENEQQRGMDKVSHSSPRAA